MRINREADYGEYDMLGIANLVAMSMRYVANENGIKNDGQDVPSGRNSDLDCSIWETINEAIRMGIAIGKGDTGSVEQWLRWYRKY